MTLSGYCLHIMKLPGKVKKKSRVTTDCPYTESRVKFQKLTAIEVFVPRLWVDRSVTFFFLNENCWPKPNQEKKKKKKKKFLLRLQHANLPAAPMQPRATTNLGIPDPSPSPPAPHLQHCWLHFQDMFPVSLSPLLSLSCQSLSLFLSHLDHSSSDLFRFCHFSA